MTQLEKTIVMAIAIALCVFVGLYYFRDLALLYCRARGVVS